MTPTYRLDTLAVNLIARLEPTRRAHMSDTVAAGTAFERIVGEASRALAAECRETIGDMDQASRIERETIDTFLPRYTQLALKQSRIETKGFGFLLGEGLIERIVATALAFMAALIISRIIHHWIDVAFFVLALLTPLAPEVRRWWSNRAYRAELQELSDDMGRLQDADQQLAKPPTPPVTEAPRPRPPQKDVN